RWHNRANITGWTLLNQSSPIRAIHRLSMSLRIFVSGSQNVLASQIGYLEKRPGFSTALSVTTIPGTIVRIFPWRRWSGPFVIMVCTIDTVAKVYAQTTTNGAFLLIWTSTSAVPFDFVVSD